MFPSRKWAWLPEPRCNSQLLSKRPHPCGPPHPHCSHPSRHFAKLARLSERWGEARLQERPQSQRQSKQTSGEGQRPPSRYGHLVGIPSVGRHSCCLLGPLLSHPAHRSWGTNLWIILPPGEGTLGARQHPAGPGRVPGHPTSLLGAQQGPETWYRPLRSEGPPEGRAGGWVTVRPWPTVPGGEPSHTNAEQLTQE